MEKITVIPYRKNGKIIWIGTDGHQYHLYSPKPLGSITSGLFSSTKGSSGAASVGAGFTNSLTQPQPTEKKNFWGHIGDFFKDFGTGVSSGDVDLGNLIHAIRGDRVTTGSGNAQIDQILDQVYGNGIAGDPMDVVRAGTPTPVRSNKPLLYAGGAALLLAGAYAWNKYQNSQQNAE